MPGNTRKMVGNSQLKEQAKQQWERLDTEGHGIVNELITAETEKVEWPKDTDPKFTRKKPVKATRVAYDTKLKKHMYYDNKVVADGEPIRLEIPDSFIYFYYHLDRKEYTRIDTPNRNEADDKYVVTISSCHWMWERSITILALLLYATQNVQLTWTNVKTATKETPTRDGLCQKIAEHECYTKLVDTIVNTVTSITEAENPTTKVQEHIDSFNVVVGFLWEKHIKPTCKRLSNDTIFTDHSSR